MLLSSTLPHLHLQIPPLSPLNFNAQPQQALTALQSTCRELQHLIANTHHRPLRPTIATAVTPPRTTTTTTLQSPISLRTSSHPLLLRPRHPSNTRIRKTLLPSHHQRRNTQAAKAIRQAAGSIEKEMKDSRTARLTASAAEGPRTPMGQCGGVVPSLDGSMGLFAEEEALGRRLALRGEGEEGMGGKEPDGEREGDGERGLSRCDEVIVGLLLKRLRLKGLDGRGGGR